MSNKRLKTTLMSKEIEYTLTYKYVKNINMRIKKDGLFVSAPFGTSIKYIDQLLIGRQAELVGYIEKISSASFEEPFSTGKQLMLLGKTYTLYTQIGLKNEVCIFEDKIVVYTKNGQDAKTVYEKWLMQTAKDMFIASLSRMYPLISAHISSMPNIEVKKLTASWGRCTPSKNRISLSLWLVKADKSLIDYVMLHELCHYMHLNHSKSFYSLLGSLMPDYVQRKKQLNTICLGP